MLLSAITPAATSRAGGDTVTITGTFLTTATYRVRVDGILAYSGVSGQKEVIMTDGSEIRFVVPTLPEGGPSVVEVEEIPGGATEQIGITALERSFGSVQYELRQLYPSRWDTGPRRIDLEPDEIGN